MFERGKELTMAERCGDERSDVRRDKTVEQRVIRHVKIRDHGRVVESSLSVPCCPDGIFA
jgi:hypothetical protein